ncbi:MAG: alanine--tRNA ligase [Thermotogaceae bacterium]|nr:alanine--tRNA ligase [Thermotogaceae bacterium]
MRNLSSEEIRQEFLKFFENKGHKVLPSASLVPDDPQLMFTIAGMVPFKPIFWGKVKPVYKRVVTCQKCLRTTDIENVGRTPRHHTFFEMLGNFSFGDYFKREAIEWAWEFVTEVLEIPEKRLWVTIYEEDEEAYKIWSDIIGLPEYKIIRMGKKDNFWGPAGPTGPCGPDSEIHYLLDPNCKDCNPKENEDKFLEIWNLVFTQLYMDENGNYHPLEKKNIDTGAGLERIAAVLQNVPSNFDTDLFVPIIKKIEEVVGVKYGESEKTDVSIRVIADHIRASIFVIAEGVFPSNEGRGYVLRRIIRRAVRHGKLLGMNKPFLYKIVDSVVEKMGKIYPEVVEKKNFVKDILKAEEERFLKTLDQGMALLEKILNKGKVSGEDAFRLYDTYGFPVDLTVEIAGEKGVEVDMGGFNKKMEEQRKRAREALGDVEFIRKEKVYEEVAKRSKTAFTGYEKFEDSSRIIAIVKDGKEVDNLAQDNEGFVVVEKTPFYAEKGGQVADTGIMESKEARAVVLDVKEPVEGVIAHKVRVEKGKFNKGDEVILKVDVERRKAIMRNHTATHLLHAALRKILGDHVRQAGSLVAPDRLRFDFTHYQALSKEEIEKIEYMVNSVILENIPVIIEEKSYDEAVKEGAMALFDEKYGDVVRVVKVGEFSEELCGGTHVSRTGDIGLFKVTVEEAAAAGVRRIVAVTGFNSLNYLRKKEYIIEDVKFLLDVPEDMLSEKVKKLLDEIKNLEKKIKKLQMGQLSSAAQAEIKELNGIKYVYTVTEDLDNDVMRNTADSLASKIKSGVAVVFNKTDGKVSLAVKVTKDMIDKFKAGNIARRLAKILGGGGGGRPDFAQAGGKDPGKINDAIVELERIIRGE